MRVKKYLALTLAAILATTMLTACPWDQEEDEIDDASSVPVTSTDTSQDDDDDHDSGDDDGQEEGLTENKITISATEGGEVQKGTLTTTENGYTYSFSVTADEKMEITAKAIVHSPTAGELTATWPEQENTATRARTLSMRTDTKLSLTTSDNGKNFTLTGIPADATNCTISVTFKDQGYEEKDGTYMVYNADGLLAWANVVLAGDWDTDCTLTANIDLGEENWIPIGNANDNYGYKGKFDGAGYTISGLQVSGGDYVGLFGYVNGGMVKNLNLEIISVSGNYYIGGIAGYNDDGTIQGCMVSGGVSGSDCVGGVVGYNHDGTVEGCCFAGSGSSVTGSASGACVGGVVGYNYDGTITGCCFAGDSVTDTYSGAYVGGVVGYNGSGSITACYWQAGPGQGVGNDKGEGNCHKVEDGNWTDAIDAMNEALKQAGCSDISYKLGTDGKPVLVAGGSNTTELPGLTQRVLDTVRALGL